MQVRNTVELYRDAQLKHRWRYRHRNGNIMADSGQGYSSRRDAVHGANVVTNNAVRLHLVRLVRLDTP